MATLRYKNFAMGIDMKNQKKDSSESNIKTSPNRALFLFQDNNFISDRGKIE